MPYVLDTDHVSLLLQGHSGVVQRLATHPPAEIYVTLVTVQELLDGWLPQLKRKQPVERYVWAYTGLRRTLEFLCDANLLDFDTQAAKEYERLRATYRRLGTNDLRIAAIALRARATVVTRNVRDFSQVKGLTVEDWTRP
jgi:tRNA(fMet)-specific endonuclease VapC